MDGKEGKKMRACEDSSKGKEAKMLLTLTDLPTGLIMEILSWLPLKSLFKCRCVCKTWLQMISDPHFAKIHLSRSPISILIHNEYPKREDRYLRLYQVVEALDSGFVQIEETVFGPILNLPDSSFSLVNSCNGLVCLLEFEECDLLYVCNPVLGEFITIKVPQVENRMSQAFCFGFSVKTNQYKVLLSFYDKEGLTKTKLYTVGTGSWKSLGNAPSCSNLETECCARFKFNTFLHGAYHWAEYSDFNGQTIVSIVCFDFENDMFREVPSPPQFKHEEEDDLLMLGHEGLWC